MFPRGVELKIPSPRFGMPGSIDASVIHYRARSLYFVRNVLSIHSWSGLLGLVRMGHLSVKLHLRYFAYRMDYQRVPVARVDQLFESESYER